MSAVRDLFSLLIGCVALLATLEPRTFWLVVALGILFAAVCWSACNYFSRLWNLTFRLTLRHQLLASTAAILTLVATVLFASLKYTREAAVLSIDLWQQQISADVAWSDRVFAQTYEAVKSLNIEDFSQYPAPQAGGHVVPANHKESQKLTASIYANSACKHFDNHRPFLSAIVRPEVPLAKVYEDQRNWFGQNQGSTYDLSRAVDLATSEIKMGLIPQTPRVILVARILAVVGLILAQAVPFGLIARAAYKDLKVTT
jgi:hypothetical protein